MKTGKTIGTAALLAVEVGFKPSMVELFVSESSAIGYWEETMRANTFAAMSVKELRANDIIFGRHLPSIGSTTTQLANKRCTAQFNAAGATAIEVTAVAAGTAFTGTTHDVTADKWGLFLLSVQTGGTKTITPSASLAYATEALAIAAIPTVPTNEAILGYITVKATSGAIWDATTDSLAGGLSGTAAEKTNYYEGYAVMTGGITVYGANDYDAAIAAGITSPVQGFTIGTHALVNILGSIIEWKAYRD
jgi:hypothetical protein